MNSFTCKLKRMAPSVAFCILVSLVFFTVSSSAIAKTPSRPKALLLPVTKDTSTKQYIVQINQRTPSVPVKVTVDLGGESLWVDCDKGYVSSTYKPLHCRSPLCSLLNTPFGCGECYRSSSPKPGCNNHTCQTFPENSVTHWTTNGELAKDVLALKSTDGSNPGPVFSLPGFYFSCGSTFLLKGMPKGVKGVAGLGRTPIGLPSQFSRAFRFQRKFGLCLTSYGSTGVIFFGDGPYVMLPGIDISRLLSFTPLITNKNGPKGSRNVAGNDPSDEYYIGVKGIRINGKDVKLNTTLLEINEEGYGGTKISTVVPYTSLETSIYDAVTSTFVKLLSGVPTVKSVPPFKACYKSGSFGSTRLGPGIPPIDLVLGNNLTWTFFGANALVDVGGGISCLGFVDGGSGSVTSIVIGGYQLENAFLQFDLGKQRLGFVSTLLGARTTCGNFNFTSI